MTCIRCNDPKTTSDFYQNKLYKTGYETTCKKCRVAQMKKTKQEGSTRRYNGTATPKESLGYLALFMGNENPLKEYTT